MTKPSPYRRGGLQPRRIYALDGDKWKYRPSDNYEHAGGNGFGVGDKQVMYTLDTTMVHAVAICPAAPSDRSR